MVELRHLRYFVAVAEELSFRRASQRVHVDQSPLSRAVRELEQDLDVSLFARTPRAFRLTPAGIVLLEEVRELFAQLERAKRRARETDQRHRAPLRIGVADGLCQPRLSKCLAGWHQVAPETPLELSELRAVDLAGALRREELDAGFSFGVPAHDFIVQEPVWSYPLVAVLPMEHELASRHGLDLADVVAFPLIACHATEKPGIRRQVDEVIHRHVVAPAYAGEATSLNGLINMVASGLGIGLLDSGHMQTIRRSDVTSKPVNGGAAVSTYLAFRRQPGPLPHALQTLLTHATSLRQA